MKSPSRAVLVAGIILCSVFARQSASASPAGSVILPPLSPLVAPGAQGCSGTPNVQYAYANPPLISSGQIATLYWGLVGNAQAAYLQYPDGHRAGIGTPGSQQVNPTQTTTYLIIAVCGGSEVPIPITVQVNNAPGCNGSPQISSFTANPTTIQRGESSNLTWDLVGNAHYVQLSSQDQGGGGVPTPGWVQVSPNQTTTYYLTAWCKGNSVQAQVSITVSNPLPSPPARNSSQLTAISFNGGLSNPNALVITANYYWDGEDAPAVAQGTAYNSAGQQISVSNTTRIIADQNWYANLNFGINPNRVQRVNVCIIGNSGTELACQTQGH